jgi:branched-chain amino acid transport system ATP-binding protein
MTDRGSLTMPEPAAPAGAGLSLDLVGVSVAFGGNQVLEDLNTSFLTGFTGLIGPNGAGKTTLLNVICGFVAPTSGRALLGGEDLTGLGTMHVAKAGVSRTFQTPRLIEDLTVLDNVLLGFHRHYRVGHIRELLGSLRARSTEREYRARALDLLGSFGLAAFAHQPAASLPLGSQKIVEVVRALVAAPRALLLDEPAAGLGAADVDAMLEGLAATVDSTQVVAVIIEHDLALVSRLCPRAAVLHFGHIIAEGTPASVLEDPVVVDAYLGVDHAARG